MADNVADFGGVVYSELSSQLSIDGGSSVSKNIAGYGGVVYAQESLIEVNGASSLDNNFSPSGSGGVVLALLHSKIHVSGKGIVFDNMALIGNGGVALSLGISELLVEQGSSVHNNSAQGFGAVMAGARVRLQVSNNSEVYGNFVSGYGGVAAVTNCTAHDSIQCSTCDKDLTNVALVLIDGSSSVSGNSAGISGGVLFTSSAAQVQVTDGSVMHRNAAQSDGGVGGSANYCLTQSD